MTLEEMIQQMVKNGVSTEDIAKKTQDILNGIEKVEKEKKEKEKAKKQERKDYLDELREKLKVHCDTNRFNVSDVGFVAALVVAPDYPRWTVDDIKAFIECVSENIEMQAEMVGVNEDELLNKIFGMLKPKVKACKQEKKKYDDWDSLNKACCDWLLDLWGI